MSIYCTILISPVYLVIYYCIRMQRSIIPQGFEKTSHPIFRTFVPPIALPEICQPGSAETQDEQKQQDKQGVPHVTDDVSEETVCPICLGVIVDHATLVHCKHHFCAKCLLAWYKVRVNCPVCKQSGCFFLNGCRHNALQPEMKLWTVEGAAEAVAISKPSNETIRLAVIAHCKICKIICKHLPSEVDFSISEVPIRKKSKLS